jgi:hypothetical protein
MGEILQYRSRLEEESKRACEAAANERERIAKLVELYIDHESVGDLDYLARLAALIREQKDCSCGGAPPHAWFCRAKS